jgi:hypothetical protein
MAASRINYCLISVILREHEAPESAKTVSMLRAINEKKIFSTLRPAVPCAGLTTTGKNDTSTLTNAKQARNEREKSAKPARKISHSLFNLLKKHDIIEAIKLISLSAHPVGNRREKSGKYFGLRQ